MKKYIYIIIGIIVLAAIAIGVLLFIKNNSNNAGQNTNATTSNSNTLPVTGTQGSNNSTTTPSPLSLSSSGTSTSTAASGQATVQNFGVLSNTPISDYFVDENNNITAIEPTGQVILISNGQTTVINSSTLNAIISAEFSYDGKKIVVSYGDPVNPQGALFDVATNSWTVLPQGMLSPQWSPVNNYQIAYLAVTKNGGLSLATINAANLKAAPSTLLTLNAEDLTLQWPSNSEFILSDRPTSQSAGSIWAFNSSAGTLAPLVYETPGVEGIWSHDAAIPYGLVFFNNTTGQGSTLQLQAISGSLPTEAVSFLTLPSKCAFNPEMMPVATSTTANTSTTTPARKALATPTSTPYLALYCGIPRSSSGFSAAHLPDEYTMMALFTSDDIYKINTASGVIQSLWSDQTQNVDVSDLKFFNNALFFVNRYDQKLYGLTFSSN